MFYHFQFVVVGESTGGVCKVRDSLAVEINNTTLLYTSCLFNWEANKHIFGSFLNVFPSYTADREKIKITVFDFCETMI